METKDEELEDDDDDIPDPIPAPLTKKTDIFGFAMVALEVSDINYYEYSAVYRAASHVAPPLFCCYLLRGLTLFLHRS